MISFLVFVALLNMMLGFVCAVMIGSRLHQRLAVAHENLAQTQSIYEEEEGYLLREPIAVAHKPDTSRVTAQLAEHLESNSHDLEATGSDSIQGWETTYSREDANQQFENIRDQLSYARAAHDKQLIKKVGLNLKEWAEKWAHELEAILNSEDSELIAQLSEADGDTGELEYELAQIETTVGNLSAIDWELEVEDIVSRLETDMKNILKLL
jgi:hypothetical protein